MPAIVELPTVVKEVLDEFAPFFASFGDSILN